MLTVTDDGMGREQDDTRRAVRYGQTAVTRGVSTEHATGQVSRVSAAQDSQIPSSQPSASASGAGPRPRRAAGLRDGQPRSLRRLGPGSRGRASRRPPRGLPRGPSCPRRPDLGERSGREPGRGSRDRYLVTAAVTRRCATKHVGPDRADDTGASSRTDQLGCIQSGQVGRPWDCS